MSEEVPVMAEEKKGKGLTVQEDKSGTFTFGLPSEEHREKLKAIIEAEKSKRKKVREEKQTN